MLIGYSKIDQIILNASKKYSFDKNARNHIKLLVEEIIKEIVSDCETVAASKKYHKKHIGIGITRQVINTQQPIQNTGDKQKKHVGENEHDVLEPEVA